MVGKNGIKGLNTVKVFERAYGVGFALLNGLWEDGVGDG